jgi:hypothetical protein
VTHNHDEQNVSEETIALTNGQARRRFGQRLLVGLPLLGAALAAQQTGVAEAGTATSPWTMEGNSNVDSNDALGSKNNIALRFITNNSERLRIAANGNIGAGIANPTARMQIVSGQQVAFRAETSSAAKGTRAVLGVITAQGDLEDVAAVKGVVESRNVITSDNPLRLKSYGVWGEHRGFGDDETGTGAGIGVYGSAGGYGGIGVRGQGDAGVYGSGIAGVVASGESGVVARGIGTAVSGNAVFVGVYGEGEEAGVVGVDNGRTSRGVGVRGSTRSKASTNYAIYGEAEGDAFAGYFDGKVQINGTLSKSAGSFKIDHPLDPQNKYLSHSFVESPDMMNVYNGNVTTDAQGKATVTLPAYFEALNRDFRYQLTVVGLFAQAIVEQEVKGNQFRIATDKPNVKVSWQVTGIRQDAYAKANPIVVEEDKPAEERGSYLQPEAHGQSAEKALPQRAKLRQQQAASEARHVKVQRMVQQLADLTKAK